MITVKNILTEYPGLDQAKLPAALKQAEFDFLAENIDLYGQDETIDQFIDTFVDKLNELAPTKKKVSRKAITKSRKLTTRKANKTKVKPLKNTAKKVKRTSRKKLIRKVSKVKAKPTRVKEPGRKIKRKSRKLAVHRISRKRPVRVVHSPAVDVIKPVRKPKTGGKGKRAVLNEVPAWLMTIRKFTRMANREYTQKTLRLFLKDIQSKFNAKRNGSPTPHIDIIRKIQLTIVTSVNEQLKKDKVKLKVNSNLVSDCRALSNSYKIKQEKETGNVQVEPLAGTKKKKKECCPFSGFGIVSSEDLAKMSFTNLQFSGKWKDLIGNPTLPFHFMAYGLPGSGKSTLAIRLAKYLAADQNLKVLFLAREEGISGTTQEKFIRLDAVHSNIDITEKMPADLSRYDVIVIDSVNEMNMKPDDIRQIQAQYPKLSTVQVFKATKEGKFLGQSDFAHLVQVEIRCFEGKAQALKNRFGGNIEIEI